MTHAASRADPSLPGTFALGAVVIAAAVGTMTLVSAPMTAAALAGVILAGMVALHPPIAAYMLLAATPLAVGLGRDSLLPLLRPNEVLALVLGTGLVMRGIAGALVGRPLRVAVTPVDLSLVALAVTGSVLPLLWMVARGADITRGDLLYAAVLWKYLAFYLIVRTSVQTEREVSRCLAVTLTACGVAAVVGLLQVLQLFGVPEFLRHYYPGDIARGLEVRRATGTLASWLAMADVMIFNLAIAVGWLVRRPGRSKLFAGLTGLFALGALAAGELSGFLAFLAAVAVLGVITGRRLRDALRWLVPLFVVAGLILSPVLEARLRYLDPASGLPASWVGRRENLEKRILPHFTPATVVLGVRPAARVPAPEKLGERWVYIESGHLWLLWSGGIPMFLAFFVFLWLGLRTTAPVARGRRDAIGVAATASFVALVVLAVATPFDPHLTHRGTADLSFSLLALALVRPHPDRHGAPYCVPAAATDRPPLPG